MRAGEEALGGEDGLPPRVPEGRSFGCRGADKDCSSRYRRLRPRSACHCPAVVYALLQPQQPLGSSEAWRATGSSLPQRYRPACCDHVRLSRSQQRVVHPQVADKGSRDPRGMHDKAGKSLRHMVRGAAVGRCPSAVAGCPCPPTGARRRGHVHDGLFAAGGSPVRPAIVRAVCRDDRSG